MAEKILYIVQQFEKQGRTLVPGRQMDSRPPTKQSNGPSVTLVDLPASSLLSKRSIRKQVKLEEPVIVAQYGEVPAGIAGD